MRSEQRLSAGSVNPKTAAQIAKVPFAGLLPGIDAPALERGSTPFSLTFFLPPSPSCPVPHHALINNRWKAITTHPAATQGLSLSPILAAFQNIDPTPCFVWSSIVGVSEFGLKVRARTKALVQMISSSTISREVKSKSADCKKERQGKEKGEKDGKRPKSIFQLPKAKEARVSLVGLSEAFTRQCPTNDLVRSNAAHCLLRCGVELEAIRFQLTILQASDAKRRHKGSA